jgi:hypothetical protein
MAFLERPRDDDAPKRASETHFGFLDRCSWPAAQRVRNFINECLSNYPAEEQPELTARIRSGDNVAFRSGMFELFLHEYLRRKGFALTPHPQLPNGATTRPDFLVTCPAGNRFYLEAVCASDRDGRNQGGEALIATTLQHLNEATHADFFVEVESSGYPNTQPSGRKLVADVVSWLNTLNADDALAALDRHDFDHLPTMEWKHEEWELTLTALPCRPDARGQQRRLIGVRNFGGRWVDSWTPIRDAVMTKARKYGDLALPLVVAVNLDSDHLDAIDEMQALFGQENFVFDICDTDGEPRMERAQNGAWIGPAGPRATRCSGAWIFRDVNPYTISRRKHRLYINPWASRPVPTSVIRLLPTAEVIDNQIKRTESEPMGPVLGLSEEWPE